MGALGPMADFLQPVSYPQLLAFLRQGLCLTGYLILHGVVLEMRCLHFTLLIDANGMPNSHNPPNYLIVNTLFNGSSELKASDSGLRGNKVFLQSKEGVGFRWV